MDILTLVAGLVAGGTIGWLPAEKQPPSKHSSKQPANVKTC